MIPNSSCFPCALVQIEFSRADVRVVYFRRFGLNISDLQQEHMLRGATAMYHVPFCRPVTLAAEKEAEQSSLELWPDRLQSQPVDRPRSFSVKTPTLKHAPALRPVDPNAVSSSVSITVGQSGRELTQAWQRGGKKTIVSVRRMMAERNITLSNWPGTALKVCGRVHMCIRAHLSWYSSSIWAATTSTSGLSTQNMSARLRAAAFTVVIWTSPSLW